MTVLMTMNLKESCGRKEFTSHNVFTHLICLLINGCLKRYQLEEVHIFAYKDTYQTTYKIVSVFLSLIRSTREFLRGPDRGTNYNAAKHPGGLLPALCLAFLKSMPHVLISLNNLQCSFACPGKLISLAELCWLHIFFFLRLMYPNDLISNTIQ